MFFILAGMKVFSNFNRKVFIASLFLIAAYTFLSYWAAIIIDDGPSESPIINFFGRYFSMTAEYPFLILLIPIRLIPIMLFWSFIDFTFWALLIERIIYFVRLTLNKIKRPRSIADESR